MLRRWLLLGLCSLLLLSCGEPVPVDCTPDEEQCTSETEGGFETGTVAGVAAGGAAVIALVGGASLGGGDDGGGSGGGSSSTTTPSTPTTAKVGVLLDSVVAGVSFETSSGLTGLTNASGEFSYQTGDTVSFRLGDVELGSVAASPVLTPVELVGAVSTADRRVINLSRFLQSVDDDADPTNGLSVTKSARTALSGRSLNFNLPVSTFEITASVAVQAASGRTLVDASTAINHLHGTLGERGLVTQVAEEDEIQQVVPAFVADSTLAEAVSSNPELCKFNNTLLSSGQSVIAYQSALVSFEETCSSQTRTCNNGALSGSYSATSCSARSANSCSLSGQAVEHGASVTAYASDSVAFGGSCTSQTRTCNNGVLSGSYSARTCQVASAASCTFNGEPVAHGTSFTAYAASKVDAGGSCSAQLRSCKDGVISGSYAFASCEVEEEVTIQPVCFFDGIAINHGTIVTAYADQNVPYGSVCSAELRTCNGGDLSGSNAYSNCRVADPVACAFNSLSIAHGNSVTAYRDVAVDYGASCLSEQRLCSNGVLSGSNAYSSCRVSEASSCSFNGQTVSSGSSVTAYESNSVNFGSSCQTQLRSCTNGTLSGSYTNAACGVASAASCTFNGQTVAHGTSVNAYQAASVAFGSSCTSQSRTCSNGTLSGSYTNSTCNVAGAQSCSFNGETVNDGQAVTAYQGASVAYGSSCTSESRSCSNGSLSGSYSFGSCSVQSPATCSLNGQTIAHDASVTAYQTSSVAYGQNCSSETRSCSNGTLGGTFTNSSCSVAAAASCSFGGQTVTHGSSITAYLADSVAYGQSCSTQTRSCSNGTLSGTYENSSCSVATAASCSFNGQTVAHGSSVTAYQAASVANGSSCSSESRSCSNGTLSGTYTNSNCSIEEAVWSGSKQLGTSADDYAWDVATDSNGNVYLTGYTEGGLDGNISAGGKDLFVVKYDSIGTKQWTQQLGTSYDEYGRSITTDSSGNVYVTGETLGSLDGNTNSFDGDADVFVVKYNSSGIKQWTQQLGVFTSDNARGIVTDSSGNIFVAGYTMGDLDGNTSSGSFDIFVVKYNSSGVKQWTQQIGTSGEDFGEDIAIDSNGNLYVTGKAARNLDDNSNSNSNIFVVKYNGSGVKQWTQQIGTTTDEGGRGIAIDSSGKVYVTGYTYGGIDGNTDPWGNVPDLFIVKYDDVGTWQWTRQPGTGSRTHGNGIATDSAGNIYVTGSTLGGLDGNPFANLSSSDLFVMKYNSAGTRQWAQQLGTPGEDVGHSVTTDAVGNIYVAGETAGGLDSNTNFGGKDIYLVKYDSAGNLQ